MVTLVVPRNKAAVFLLKFTVSAGPFMELIFSGSKTKLLYNYFFGFRKKDRQCSVAAGRVCDTADGFEGLGFTRCDMKFGDFGGNPVRNK